jgi:hypothetical protein
MFVLSNHLALLMGRCLEILEAGIFSPQRLFLATRLPNLALKMLVSLALPLQKHHLHITRSIAHQFISIKKIAISIMAGGSQPHDAAVGSPAPKQMGRATIDTLK